MRRATRAAAAPPNRSSIGGAGTSVGGPPVVELPPLDELLLVELDVELELEVELDVDELLLVLLDVDDPPVEVDVEEPPVDVDVDEPPVEVDVDEPPVEVLVDDPPVEVEVEPPLDEEVEEITTPPLPLVPPQKPPPPKKPPPQLPPLLLLPRAAGVATLPPAIGVSIGARAATVTTPGVQVVVVVTVRRGFSTGALWIAGAEARWMGRGCSA